ncbi:kinesin motor domain containing protein [Stylonychia lemnae]|uniref:Kinesin-like protein n=1 Tax=Stylonychia lemnae TaxID=5949 RepID=A0A078BCA2_STYLE|nr:kinesin motor domain containing protein [Stylonychia lemnae]|eukprot:CDW90867.1 kinesin motor domain containing protein [Stylonychia lemnae]
MKKQQKQSQSQKQIALKSQKQENPVLKSKKSQDTLMIIKKQSIKFADVPLEIEDQKEQAKVEETPQKKDDRIKVTNNRIKVSDASHLIESKYDLILDQKSSQRQVYSFVQDAVKEVFDGINSTILAYGQTGSGKTYTMFGPLWEENVIFNKKQQRSQLRNNLKDSSFAHNQDQEGIIPRSIREIFNLTKQQQNLSNTIYCSFIQIYNEKIFDLLQDGEAKNALKIREEETGNIFVEGLSEYIVQSEKDCFALLRRGEINRITRQTKKNMLSSRSHSIFQMLIENEKPDARGFIKRAKLNLCDLAGSEKIHGLLNDQIESNAHLSELKTINLSLTTLGKVISALCKESKANRKAEMINAPKLLKKGDHHLNKIHIPYRDSHLTRILQDSLGGNTRTVLIATVSPIIDNIDESISTLKFADRAKQVMTNVKVNEINAHDDALVQKLQKEVQALREVLAIRRKGQNSDIQSQFLRLKEENLKLKEIAQNVDMVEKLKIENKLMRLELQRLKDGSDFGNTIRSTDMSMGENMSQSSKIIRKSYNSNKIDSMMDFQDNELLSNTQVDDNAVMHVQQERQKEVNNLMGALQKSGRCPICTLMPPCNHYKSQNEINRQNINEENEEHDEMNSQESPIIKIKANKHARNQPLNLNTQSLPTLNVYQSHSFLSPKGEQTQNYDDNIQLSHFSPQNSKYGMFKTNKRTQKNAYNQNNLMLPEINTSSSKYSQQVGYGPDNFSQQISSRNNSQFKSTFIQPFNSANNKSNAVTTQLDDEEENDQMLNIRIRGKNNQFTNQKSSVYNTIQEQQQRNVQIQEIIKQQLRVKKLEKMQKEREEKSLQKFELEIQKIKQKYKFQKDNL